MYFHLLSIGIVSIAAVVLQQDNPVELIPVDGGVADRGSLSDSLRSMPMDLRQNQSFEKLYKVAGSEDVYVRQAGGLRAVFKNSAYIDTETGAIPIVPAGTVYCIGEVTHDVLRQLGVLVKLENQLQEVQTSATDSYNPRRTTASRAPRNTIKFLDDESYRRKRLAMFVLDVVLN
jgi:hypothetical protein